MSRLIAKELPDLVRIGQTRATQYGLLRPLDPVGCELPLFRVSPDGELKPAARMLLLHQSVLVTLPGPGVFRGLPPEIADLAPQGFLGRAFAERYATELGLPRRLQDWSDDHVLISVARRGEDGPGNLIVGRESAERWQRLEITPATREEYPALARLSLRGQAAGSSAGGEQPKFTAYVDGRHCIVKFAGTEDTPAERRWRDLLFCESIALEVLREAGISAAHARTHETGGMLFLEIERFDRVGRRGRQAVLTLAALDSHLYGKLDTWAAAATRLERDRRISAADARTLRLLEAFSRLIGDTDTHFHNIALFPDEPAAAGSSLSPGSFKLAPAFDKLPMFFAPTAGRLVDRRFVPPVPDAALMDVWDLGRELAEEFWRRVRIDRRVSELLISL